MATRPRGIVSRRAALAGFAATAVASVSASAEPAPGDATAENAAGPVFSPSGPNAELYGADPAARRLGRLVTVEHDPGWFAGVSRQLEQSALRHVDYRLIALEHPIDEPTRPVYDPVPRYVSFVDEFPDDHFDFIEVDGHYRQACVAQGRQKLKPGGLLLVDDTNWLPIEAWGVPPAWHLVHQSVKINTTTSIWRRPPGNPGEAGGRSR